MDSDGGQSSGVLLKQLAGFCGLLTHNHAVAGMLSKALIISSSSVVLVRLERSSTKILCGIGLHEWQHTIHPELTLLQQTKLL